MKENRGIKSKEKEKTQGKYSRKKRKRKKGSEKLTVEADGGEEKRKNETRRGVETRDLYFEKSNNIFTSSIFFSLF